MNVCPHCKGTSTAIHQLPTHEKKLYCGDCECYENEKPKREVKK